MERYAHIVGWGMAVPEKVLTNDDLARMVDTSDEWIASRTGIRERRIAGPKETTASLAILAAQNALEIADIEPDTLDPYTTILGQSQRIVRFLYRGLTRFKITPDGKVTTAEVEPDLA